MGNPETSWEPPTAIVGMMINKWNIAGVQLLSGNLGQENGPLLRDLPMKHGDVSWTTLQ